MSEERNLSNKPSDSAFRQQRLSAWQPILTAGSVIPLFFALGVSLIPMGISILYFSDLVKEKVVDYTFCTEESGRTCSDKIGISRNSMCHCTMNLTLDNDFPGNVFIYYGLTNFYQNHRRYVKSRDDVQLLGQLKDEVSNDCMPYAYVNENDTKQIPIAPCGAIANSFFTDRFELLSKGRHVPLLKKHIAWPSDKEVKFKNPPGDLKTAFSNFSKPVDWRMNVWELDLEDETNNGFQNEDFIVWMRTAALPNFRKLFRRVNATGDFINGLSKGEYVLKVNYTYPVTYFNGTKSFIISTTSVLGAKNSFLGYAYLTTGSFCLILAHIFLIIHVKYGKKSIDVANVTPATPFS